ncbi:MAG TPA: AraC family transcriptional regulator [Vicinamibacterales bacterium]|nr:AraC family transcriptional regulator [Vicinamibacterales bacterium]
MDDGLRPDLLTPRGDTGPLAAPFELRHREPALSPESGRETLGPALFATPLVTVGRWRCPRDSRVFADSGPARGHLVVFPRTGVWIQHEGGERFVADPTVVTFYNAGQRYRRFPLSASGDRGEWYAVAPEAVAHVVRRHDPGAVDRGPRVFPFSHGPSDRASYVAQRAVYEHVCRHEQPDPLYVEEAVLDVLDRVTAQAFGQTRRGADTGSAADRELADALLSVIARRYADRASLHDLAGEVGCSPFHLARAFKRVTGRTVHAHRTDLRMRAALDALADPACDLLTLALSLGYSSHSHFGEVFGRAFRQAPSALRRRLGGAASTAPP